MIEGRKDRWVEQRAIVESFNKLQKHVNVLSTDPVDWQWILKQEFFVVDSSCKVQTEKHQTIE